MRGFRVAAAAWAGAMLACAAFLGFRLSHGLPLETRLLALLPESAQEPVVTRALSQLTEAASKQVIILVGGKSLHEAGQAADVLATALLGKDGIAHVVAKVEAGGFDAAREFFFPFRYGLLSRGARARLRDTSDAALLGEAMQRLYSPVAPPRLASLEEDPLGVFSDGLLEAASQSVVHVEESRLWVGDGESKWVVVWVELAHSGASMTEEASLMRTFDEAQVRAQAAGATSLVHAGFLFHSAAAAKKAQAEMSTIGVGSLVGIIALMLATFRSVKPLVLAALPILVGCLVAVAASLLLFGKLQLLTLVFGTSIIGVAVDYGFLFVAGRVSSGPWDAERRRAEVLPSVAMALGTSLLAYAVLASLPFPMLRQMGVFAMLGLGGAWLTAVLWLPFLSARLKGVTDRRVVGLLGVAKDSWPRVEDSRPLQITLGLAILLSLVGISRLESDNDVRLFYSPSPPVVREEHVVERLMQTPAAGQFFVLAADSEEELLERDEALSSELSEMKGRGLIANFQSISTFVPSQKTQEENKALLWQRVYAPTGIAAKLFDALGSPTSAKAAAARARRPMPQLRPRDWLASTISSPFRSLWLGKTEAGFASVVTLSGIHGDSALSALVRLSEARPGVQFVDHLERLKAVLGGLSVRLSWLALLGYVVVSGLLVLRYGRETWRVLCPVAVACLMTAGVFGLAGLNCSLFCVFGLLLSLDMGVDYAIYLQEKGSGDLRASLLGASLSALATLLSFGLLALSSTPALRTFGLTVLLAIGLSWLLAPCFSKRST